MVAQEGVFVKYYYFIVALQMGSMSAACRWER
jgi:hypothetical protein